MLLEVEEVAVVAVVETYATARADTKVNGKENEGCWRVVVGSLDVSCKMVC